MHLIKNRLLPSWREHRAFDTAAYNRPFLNYTSVPQVLGNKIGMCSVREPVPSPCWYRWSLIADSTQGILYTFEWTFHLCRNQFPSYITLFEKYLTIMFTCFVSIFISPFLLFLLLLLLFIFCFYFSLNVYCISTNYSLELPQNDFWFLEFYFAALCTPLDDKTVNACNPDG